MEGMQQCTGAECLRGGKRRLVGSTNTGRWVDAQYTHWQGRDVDTCKRARCDRVSRRPTTLPTSPHHEHLRNGTHRITRCCGQVPLIDTASNPPIESSARHMGLGDGLARFPLHLSHEHVRNSDGNKRGERLRCKGEVVTSEMQWR